MAGGQPCRATACSTADGEQLIKFYSCVEAFSTADWILTILYLYTVR
jgi:hypothetical protein